MGEPVPPGSPAYDRARHWIQAFLFLLGAVLVVVWCYVALVHIRVTPRPVFDASFLMGALLILGSYALSQKTIGPWLIGLGACGVAILVGFYLLVSILFDPAIVFRPALLIGSSLLIVAAVVALVVVLQADTYYGASGLRKAAIAGTGTLTAALGIATTGFSLWFGSTVGPVERPARLDLDATIAPVLETANARVYAITITAKNPGDERVMYIGDVYNAASESNELTTDTSYRCSLYSSMGDPTDRVDGCPSPLAGLPPLGEDVHRSVRGLNESWLVFQSGRLLTPGSWLEPGGSEVIRATLLAPKTSDLVRDTIRIAIARGDRLTLVPFDQSLTSCRPGEGVSVVYERLGSDVLPSLVAAADPVQFQYLWTLDEKGADVELCPRQGDRFVEYPEGDRRIDAVVEELGLVYVDLAVEGYWKKP